MYCKNCGAKVVEKAKFCNRCGQKLFLEPTPFGGNSYISDEDFKKAYVSNNYEKLKEEKFSVPFFFLNGYYLFYRKMWLYAFLWILFIILINAFSFIYHIPYLFGIFLGLRVFLSLSFSKIYFRFVDRKIEKIKQKNSDKTKQEILEICKKKGGVSVLAAILSFLFIMIVVTFTMVGFLLGTFMEEIKEEDQKRNTHFHDLYYTVPEVFGSMNFGTDAYQNFSYEDSSTSCNMNMMSHNLLPNKKEEDYLESRLLSIPKDQRSDILSQEIHGSLWKYVEVISKDQVDYYYASIYKGKIYQIQYTISNDDYKLCSVGYTNFIDSLVFQDKEYQIDKVYFQNNEKVEGM